MQEKDVFITENGFKKLEIELDELKTIKRKDIAARIKQALEFGDISENSEYDQAKNEQAQLEDRILKVETLLRNSKIIEDDDITTHIVNVGSRVKIKNLNDKKSMEFTIVGSAEADPFEGKISNESPVGSALIGHKNGDTVGIDVPDGVVEYKIMKIMK